MIGNNVTGHVGRMCVFASGVMLVCCLVGTKVGVAADAQDEYAHQATDTEEGALRARDEVEWRVYDVTFVTNGGGSVPAQRVAYGEHADEPANPSKGGYTFAGWYSDGSFLMAYDFGMPVTGDLVLYARWKRTNVARASISLEPPTCTYDGMPKYPIPSVSVNDRDLVVGTDYDVTYEHNTNAGAARVVIRGKGVYMGTASTSFTIDPASFDVTPPKAQTYAGHAILAMPTVTSGTRTLQLGPDYKLAWLKNTEPGVATVIVTGKGNYAGEKRATFPILSASEGASGD